MKKVRICKNNLLVAALATSLLLSSCSFNKPYLPKEAKETDISVGYVKGNGNNTERFLSSLSNASQSGFRFVIDDMECQLGKNFSNIIGVKEPFKAKGEILIEGLSLHEIELDVDIPINYNGLTRGLELTLADETLYFTIYNLDDADSYDVKYRVDVSPYDVTDPSTGSSFDPETGGIYQYEYGDLDWVLDDILESLTGERLKIDDESDKERFVFDPQAVMESLLDIEEGSLDNVPYFVWDLPIGEKTFNIGLRADPLTYQLTGIDFPSKAQGGYFSLSSDARLFVSASIETGNISSISAPSDGDAYVNLVDSMSIFHKVIDYVNAEKASILTRGTGLLLKHKENDFLGDGVFFNKTSIDEEASLSLRADIDMTGNSLQSIYAGIDYGYKGFHQLIDAMINGSATDAFDEVYASINDLQKAKTSKTVIDSVAGAMDEMLTNGGVKGKKKEKSGGGLAALGGALSEAIEAVKSSEGIQNINDGNYEDILKAIVSFKNTSESISLTLDLEVFGMTGFVTLNLIGDPTNPSLAYLGFDNVEVYPFSINGEIDVIPYERTPMTDEEKAKYKELRHLESLSDQFLKISETNEVKLGFSGYVLTKDTTSVVTRTVVGNKTNVPNNQGFTFDGELGIDGNNHQGTGSFVISDRKESFVNDHNVKLDITGTEPKDEDGKPIQSDEFVYQSEDPSTNWMLFEYDSKNPSGSPSSERRTEPTSQNGLKGKIAMHSVMGMMDVVKTLFASGDPRLDRIIALITNIFINSVIGDLITGQYFKFLGSDLITSITLGDRQDVFELPETIIGGESALRITVNYGNDVNRDDGTVIGGNIESLEIEMSIGVSNIYAKIDLLGNEMQEMNWPDIDSTALSQFSNFSSLKTLAEYGVNMFLAGDEVTSPSGKSLIRSAYRIEGGIVVDLPILSDIVIDFRVFVRVEGADIRIAAYLIVPINPLINSNDSGIIGIGGSSGKRYINLLFHSSGNDDGTLLIDRWDDYGNGELNSRQNVKDFHFQTRLTAKGFTDNLFDYLTKDIFGLNNTLLTLINFTSSGSSGQKQSLHGEDLIKSLTFNNDMNNPEWYLDLSTSALLHNNLFSDIKLTLGGTYAGGKKLLNKVKTREPITILSIIKAELNCEILNFTPDYYYCWDDEVSNLPYNIYQEASGTRTYYTTQFAAIKNNEFYENNFMIINSDGTITLAPSFEALPIDPTPNSHI